MKVRHRSIAVLFGPWIRLCGVAPDGVSRTATQLAQLAQAAAKVPDDECPLIVEENARWMLSFPRVAAGGRDARQYDLHAESRP
jgi:hypothetical protein